ncbi:helix-turn-helix transcriptional regulator [Acetobacter orientalis]|uniref:helix-turn-helix transcriptional regulator n=1 Tax=Acetobacter orientalis TaxID=146474 RepID=UPI0039E761A0
MVTIQPETVWHMLDTLAFERGLTPSALAKAAGLDATTFNPSRRVGGHGGYRWPAMPSLLAALSVLHVPWSVFAQQVEGVEAQGLRGSALGAPAPTQHRHAVRQAPALPLSRLSETRLYDEQGYPVGLKWEHAMLPTSLPAEAYSVRVDSPTLEPTLREGSSLVLLPDHPLRRSDRVLLVRQGQAPVVGIWQAGLPPVITPFYDPSAELQSIVVPENTSGLWVHRIVMMTL